MLSHFTKVVGVGGIGALSAGLLSNPVQASDALAPPVYPWTFSGFFDSFDTARQIFSFCCIASILLFLSYVCYDFHNVLIEHYSLLIFWIFIPIVVINLFGNLFIFPVFVVALKSTEMSARHAIACNTFITAIWFWFFYLKNGFDYFISKTGVLDFIFLMQVGVTHTQEQAKALAQSVMVAFWFIFLNYSLFNRSKMGQMTKVKCSNARVAWLITCLNRNNSSLLLCFYQ